MKDYMNLGVKSVISQYPKVGDILQSYDIGCITCSVGTCLLKDVIEIHNIPKDKEAEMMDKIEKVMAGQSIGIIGTAKKENDKTVPKVLNYSAPINKLVSEHKLIKRFLAIVPQLCQFIKDQKEIDAALISDCLNFIRFYADKYHHAKEEDILFQYATGNQDIIQVMLEDHKTGRGLVKAINNSLVKQDRDGMVRSLLEYKALLSQHIIKEDEILYPWMDRHFNGEQMKRLEVQFEEVDRQFGPDFEKNWKYFVSGMESMLAQL